jgi:hypothetical protein
MNKKELMEKLTALGASFDKRWGVTKLKLALVDAMESAHGEEKSEESPEKEEVKASSDNEIIIIDGTKRPKKVLRVYSEKVHGPNFMELAKSFLDKNRKKGLNYFIQE